ncbi:flavin reductase family protein [Tepidamorphus sp. 3E244]|uniref:flavin reductase family protein n=1 Tax=Tepidamorphus sp. 3E244 TaxID=3385498 RepID=UPI0038FCCAFB
MSALDPDVFRQAMRRTASGVTVVTTDGDEGPLGVTVSSLCSLSLEPPSILFCLHRESRLLPIVKANGVFAANILADGQQRVADSFAGLIPELREDRFAAGHWSTLVTGSALLDGALCAFDCKLASIFEFGSHSIIAGEVLAAEMRGDKPLIYSGGDYRQLETA